MDSTNVELVGQVVEAINQRNPDRLAALVADEFEWVTYVATVEVATYRGDAGIRQFFEDSKSWASIEARVDEVRDLGDRAQVVGELTWRARGGALTVRGPLASVVYFEDGRVKRIRTYRGASAPPER